MAGAAPAVPMLCPEHHKAGIALLFGLGFDETDLRPKLQEKITVDRTSQPQTFVVELLGDVFVSGLHEEKHGHQAELTRLAQIPLRFIKKDSIFRTAPSEAECTAFVDLVRQFFADSAPLLAEQLERVEMARDALKVRYAASTSGSRDAGEILAAASRVSKLMQSLAKAESCALEARQRCERVRQAAATAASLLPAAAARLNLLAVETAVPALWGAVLDIFRVKRRAATKLLMLRSKDAVHFDSSRCAALYLIDTLNEADFISLCDRARATFAAAGMPQEFCGHDGAFEGLRHKTAWNGTRTAVALQAEEFAMAQVRSIREDFGGAIRADRAAEAKARLLAEWLLVVHPQGLPPQRLTDWDRIVPAGTTAYPGKLRCDPAAASVADAAFGADGLDPAFAGMAVPEFTGADIRRLLPRGAARCKSPIEVATQEAYTPDAAALAAARVDFEGTRLGEVPSDQVLARLCRLRRAVDDNAVNYVVFQRDLAQARYETAIRAYVGQGRDFDRYWYVPRQGFIDFEDPAHLEKNMIHGLQRQEAWLAAALNEHATQDVGEADDAVCMPVAAVTLNDMISRLEGEARDDLDPSGLCEELCLDSRNLLLVALKYDRFTPIKNVLLTKCDKQVRRFISMRPLLFHT